MFMILLIFFHPHKEKDKVQTGFLISFLLTNLTNSWLLKSFLIAPPRINFKVHFHPLSGGESHIEKFK